LNTEQAVRANTQLMRGVVADKAITVIEEYRSGKHHGRDVSAILSELFEAANDTFEAAVLKVPARPKPPYLYDENNPPEGFCAMPEIEAKDCTGCDLKSYRSICTKTSCRNHIFKEI